MRGVILAGGEGTRLLPLTQLLNKHLLPIFNKPMILYPLETLKGLGISEILIVSGGENIGGFADFLGDGSDFGVHLTYRVQKAAGGIAQALGLAESFVDGQFAVILGDNIFGSPIRPPKSCGIVLKEVPDPSRFGVYCDGIIEEKPKVPRGTMAVTGLYFYTPEIFRFIQDLKPSDRGELEITDVNNWCLEHLPTEIITYKGFWSDAGTFESLLTTAQWARSTLTAPIS